MTTAPTVTVNVRGGVDGAALGRELGRALGKRSGGPVGRAPTDDLVRMLPMVRAELRVDTGDGDPTGLGTLFGFAAVFDTDTVIDSWEGRFVERIAQGAFAATLAERGGRVKVLFNHGFDPSVGDKPLGKPAVMDERAEGLWTETPLDDTSYNRDLAASLRSGALDGMSFRFSVTAEEWDEPKDKTALPVRTIRGVELYEFGPVTFPAYEATTAGIRSRDGFAAWRASGRRTRPGEVSLVGEPGPELWSGPTPVPMPLRKDRLILMHRLTEATR